MNAVQSFLSRRAADSGFYCPCCRSIGLDADDMVLSGNRMWGAETIAAASDRYRAPICNACMDNHVWTQDGAFVPRESAVRDDFGDWWSDEDQLADALAEAAEDADLRQMCGGWR